MKRPSLLVLAAALLLGPAILVAQQGVFRGGVETVPIYATVTDAAGRLVPDLAEEHFEILDNGKLQKIAFFRSDVQPVSVVVALDMSGSMIMNIGLAKNAAEAFVLRMLPQDRALLMAFDDKIMDSRVFTSNRDDLVRYLHTEMQYGNGTRLWDAVDASLSRLAKEVSRKVVLVLSDGADTASSRSRDEVLARAQADDVMVYAIGLHSQYRGGPGGSMVRSTPDRGLRRVAEETGGGYFELTKAAELNSTFTRVADELHRQYVLGFSPEVMDNRVHKLDLRVKVPGMTARSRKSYVASKEGAPAASGRGSRIP
jgi:Ca-activated chloride channel family protein